MKYRKLCLFYGLISSSVCAQNLPQGDGEQADNRRGHNASGGETRPAAPPQMGWTITAGPSAMLGPRFIGTSAAKILPVPNVEISDGKRFTLSAYRGVRYEAVKGEVLSLGPLLRPSFGRSHSETDAYLPGLSKIGFAPEVGGFAKVSLSRYLSVSAELRKALGGHDGIAADIGANYTKRAGKVMLGFGPKVTFANAKYMQAHFGVTPFEAQRGTFTVFAPKGGMRGGGIDGFGAYTLGGGKSVGVFASYERLGGVIKRSPIFDAPSGSKDQFRIGLSFSFTILGKSSRS